MSHHARSDDMAGPWNMNTELAEKKLLLPILSTPNKCGQLVRRTLFFASCLICTLIFVAKLVSLSGVLPSLAVIRGSDLYASPSSNACSSISLPAFSDFRITSTQGHEVHNYSLPGLEVPELKFCNFTVTLTHEGANDSVIVSIWLPLKGWNGRFLGTGGGGLAAGFEGGVAYAMANNYVGAMTDAGLTLNNTIEPWSGKWGLNSDGTPNNELLKNFADRSIHDMVVVSKVAVEAFYRRKPHFSYYFGCSTGGRMGYFAAQKHPEDFDGILANAPAIDSTPLGVGDFWPVVVMNEIVVPPRCIFERYWRDIIQFCDPLDGATDGLISDLDKCIYDTKGLIGSNVTCAEGEVTITSQHSEVVKRILEGPKTADNKKLYTVIAPGASFDGTANTTTINGSITPAPFTQSEFWIKYFVAQDPDYDTRDITFSQFEEIFIKSIKNFDDILGVRNPDLSAFKAHGGKLLTWHGLADQLIHPELMITYRQRLEANMGGAEAVDDFQRLFLAPGAGHCGGGIGPVPDVLESLGILQKWVESGIAPDTLPARTEVNGAPVTRDLCRYPRVLKYDGKGDVRSAGSFTCG